MRNDKMAENAHNDPDLSDETPRADPAPARPVMNPGGDTSDAHIVNVRKVKTYLATLKRDGLPLPAKPQRPHTVSMPIVAKEAGVYVEGLVRHGTALRKLVEDAIPVCGVAIRPRDPVDNDPRLSDLMPLVIDRRRAELERDLVEPDYFIARVREMFKALSRREDARMAAPARLAFTRAQADLQAGTFELSRDLQAEFNRALACLDDLDKTGGLPDNFAEALRITCQSANLTLSELARRVGAVPQTVINWSSGLKCPDARSNNFIKRIEHELNLKPQTLTSRIRRRRAGRGRLAADYYPAHLRGPEHRRLRSEISRRLPDDARFLEDDERYHRIEQICENLKRAGQKRAIRGKLLKKNYALRNWPDHLKAQWDELVQHKQMVIPAPGIINGAQWVDGSVSKWRHHLSLVFGFLISEDAAKMRVNVQQLGFELLCDPKIAHAFLAFKIKRAVAAGGQARLTATDVDLLTFCGALFAIGGWIRQNDAIASLRGFAERSDAWEEYCRKIAAQYRELERDQRRKIESADDKESVLPILRLQDPMKPIHHLIGGLKRDYEALDGSTPSAAMALQDLIWTQIQIQVALRPGTWVKLEYRADNSGHLKKDQNGWFIDVPRELFKNRRGKAVRDGVEYRLVDHFDLYAHLEKFLTFARPILRGELKTDALVLYGATYLDPSYKCIIKKPITNEREKALARRVCTFTRRHLGSDPDIGFGLENFEGISPTAFRHILATAIVKKTGDMQLAADAIADSLDVARRHYAHFLPTDRRPRVASTIQDVLSEDTD